MAQNMLKSKNILWKIWTEAVDCDIYLKEANYYSLTNLWGCESIAYARVYNELRKKLDYKSEKHVYFVNYDARVKGYKLYNPINAKDRY